MRFTRSTAAVSPRIRSACRSASFRFDERVKATAAAATPLSRAAADVGHASPGAGFSRTGESPAIGCIQAFYWRRVAEASVNWPSPKRERACSPHCPLGASRTPANLRAWRFWRWSKSIRPRLAGSAAPAPGARIRSRPPRRAARASGSGPRHGIPAGPSAARPLRVRPLRGRQAGCAAAGVPFARDRVTLNPDQDHEPVPQTLHPSGQRRRVH